MRCDERADDVQGVVDKVLVVSRAELGRRAPAKISIC